MNDSRLKRLGKRTERLFRGWRPFFSPAHRRAFTALVRRGLAEHHEDEPIACFDFTDLKIDSVGGRYYFSLVLDVIEAGYFPVFVSRRVTLSTFGTSCLKSLLINRRLGVIQSPEELNQPFLLITDSSTGSIGLASRVVRIDYTTRLPESPGEIAFPVFVHPRIAGSHRLSQAGASGPLESSRSTRLFFGGNTDPGKYDKDCLRELYGMMTRREMLAAVLDSMLEGEVHRPPHVSAWLDSAESRVFVLCESQRCPVPASRWLEALAKADFFLACPGVGMPLCHNLVEAMAAGTVPILQYSDYLTPPLKEGVDCLTFHDAVSLRAVVLRIREMDAAEIEILRAGVSAYYRSHLAPGRLTEKLVAKREGGATLLLNAYRVPRPRRGGLAQNDYLSPPSRGECGIRAGEVEPI